MHSHMCTLTHIYINTKIHIFTNVKKHILMYICIHRLRYLSYIHADIMSKHTMSYIHIYIYIYGYIYIYKAHTYTYLEKTLHILVTYIFTYLYRNVRRKINYKKYLYIWVSLFSAFMRICGYAQILSISTIVDRGLLLYQKYKSKYCFHIILVI